MKLIIIQFWVFCCFAARRTPGSDAPPFLGRSLGTASVLVDPSYVTLGHTPGSDVPPFLGRSLGVALFRLTQPCLPQGIHQVRTLPHFWAVHWDLPHSVDPRLEFVYGMKRSISGGAWLGAIGLLPGLLSEDESGRPRLRADFFRLCFLMFRLGSPP